MVPFVVLGALGSAESVVEFKTDADVLVCVGINSEELLVELFGAVVNVKFCCSAVSAEMYVVDESVLVVETMTLEEDATSIVGADASACSEIVELATEKSVVESWDAVDVSVCVGINAEELLQGLLGAVSHGSMTDVVLVNVEFICSALLAKL